MGQEEIVNAILADAEEDARKIVAQAEEAAAAVRQAAESEAEKLIAETQAQTAMRAKAIADGKAATARLDGAKILLAEKRRVIASVYARAYEQLLALGEKECLALYGRLLEEYAREGDEIVIAPNFRYRAALEKLAVVGKRKLKIVPEGTAEGGFFLRGKNADVDLTYAALLAQDREEHQSEIAYAIFR